MATNIFRGPLTTALITAVQTEMSSVFGYSFPVGDGVVPQGAGWTGQPADPSSQFQPYNVIIAGPSNFSQGAFSDSQSDWHFAYMLGSYNVDRKGVDLVADNARQAVGSLMHDTIVLGTDTYVYQFVRIESIGGSNRIDATDPPYWGQIDSITLWMSKEI